MLLRRSSVLWWSVSYCLCCCFREKLFCQSLAKLKEDVVKANTLVREANFVVQEMCKPVEFSVTLQIPASNLSPNRRVILLLLERKGKEAYLYSAFYILCISQSAQAWITQFYLQIHHACLSSLSVHQMAPALTKVAYIQLQHCLSIDPRGMKGWVSLVGWFIADGSPTSGPPTATGRAQDRESSPAKDPTFFLALCHATNLSAAQIIGTNENCYTKCDKWIHRTQHKPKKFKKSVNENK